MKTPFAGRPEKSTRLILLATALVCVSAVPAFGQDIKLPPEASLWNGQQLPPAAVLGSTLPYTNPPPFVPGQVLTTITQAGQAPGGFALPPTAATAIGSAPGNALPPGAQALPAGVIFGLPPGAQAVLTGANSPVLPVALPVQTNVNSVLSQATTHLPAAWRPHS
jgi:hypothetical protein